MPTQQTQTYPVESCENIYNVTPFGEEMEANGGTKVDALAVADDGSYIYAPSADTKFTLEIYDGDTFVTQGDFDLITAGIQEFPVEVPTTSIAVFNSLRPRILEDEQLHPQGAFHQGEELSNEVVKARFIVWASFDSRDTGRELKIHKLIKERVWNG